jgi:hypothetical protein
MEGECEFDIDIKLPEDVSKEFYEKFHEYMMEERDEINSYFSELLNFKRCVFDLGISAPFKIIKKNRKIS